MAEEPFVLVSLEEKKAKQLAQVLSNDTARKILDFLSKNDKITETKISEELDMPLSTVHYNLKLLRESELVDDKNYTYSEKGKEVIHYSLANKYVIIAPKKTEILIEKLKQFLPIVLITTGISLGIKYILPRFNQPKAFAMAAQESSRLALELDSMAVPPEPIMQTQEFAVWFLLGSVVALLLYFVWAEIILKKFKSK